MNTVRILADNESYRWDAFVESHEAGCVFHTSSWRDIIRDAYGCLPVYLVVEGREGHIRAGLPAFLINSGFTGNRISSLPGAHFCNPLVDDQADFDLLISAMLNLLNQTKSDYFELKSDQSFTMRNSNLIQDGNFYSTYMLDLNRSLESMMGDFHKSCIQRVLKNIDKNSFRLLRAKSGDDLRPFYRLYLEMRRRYGLLPQPYGFFSTMWEKLSPRKQIEVYHAEYRGKIVSSAIFLHYRDTVAYEYGASDFNALQLHPSHFLLWTAIKDAQERGYRRFDFGRTSNKNTGLSEFKSRWGTTRCTLNYYYMPEVAGLARMRQDSVIKNTMNFFIKHLPPAMCHFMGRMLYRNLV